MNPPDPSVPPLEAPRDTQGTCLGRGPAVLCHHLDGNSRVLAAIARARRAFTRSAEARRAINGASSQGPALPHWGLPVRATMQGCSEVPFASAIGYTGPAPNESTHQSLLGPAPSGAFFS